MSHAIPNKQRHQSPIDRLSYALATGLGAGFVPVAPGTVGAAEGVAIFLIVSALNSAPALFAALLAVLNVALFAIGVWVSNRTCEMSGLEDPQVVVIDEVSGQLIALMPLAFWHSFSIAGIVVSFLLFRFFDILKPYPIRKLERLHGGLGVMADDALAGVYAAALVWLAHIVRLI